jgi:tetratricopeptide (TPR) repeat protein
MAVAVGIGTILAYLPSLGGRFLWDDDRYVTKAALQSVRGLWRIWTKPGATEQYYPMLHTLFWVQHRLWGENPTGYHGVSLATHVASALLFGLLLRRLAVPGAWLAALVFALHPVHVESVAWIAEQKNTISLVFFLAAALAYLRFDETRRPSHYLAALALFVLSFLSKSVTVTLPAALLVALWWKRGTLGWRRDVCPLVPWLLLGGGAGVFSSWVERRFLGAEGPAFDLSIPERILVAGRATLFYLGHVVFPWNLNFVYPKWRLDSASHYQWLFPVAAAGLLVVLLALRRRARAPAAAYLIFVGTLFPVLGFVNLYGDLYSYVWDHWQYLPDAAPLALGASALALAWGRLPLAMQRTGTLGACILGLLLASLTWARCGVFHDKETLYKATLIRNPGCWMAENNLAIYLKESGRLPEAIVHYEKALQLDPERPDIILNNLGIALADAGRLADAVDHYREALKVRPDNVDAENNLGVALATSGRLGEALTLFEDVLLRKPDRNDVRGYLARGLVTELKHNPDHPEIVHYDLGIAFSQQGRTSEAIEQLEQAVRLRPDYAEAQNDLGIAQANAGHLVEAVVNFRAVMRLRPDAAEAHLNLAEALQAAGQTDEASDEYQRAIRLDPSLAQKSR